MQPIFLLVCDLARSVTYVAGKSRPYGFCFGPLIRALSLVH